MPVNDVASVKVTIEGVDFSSTVESVNVEDHDRAIDRAQVLFDDPQGRLGQLPREQGVMQVSMGWNSENTLLFEGIVIHANPVSSGSARQHIKVTSYDLGYRMKQGLKNDKGQRVVQPFELHAGTWKDAILKVVGQYKDDGILVDAKNIILDPNPTLSQLSNAVKRANESDWDFLQRKAVDFKARAFVELNGDKPQFYFVTEKSLLKGDPMGTLFYCVGGGGRQLTAFDYQRIGSGASSSSSATVIDPKTGDPITKTADPPAPEAPLEVDPTADAELAQAADILGKAAGKPEEARPALNIVGGVSDPNKYATEVKADPTRILGFFGTGTVIGNVKIRAKGKVTIKGIAPWAEGDWYVHKVNHIYSRINVYDKKKEIKNRSTYETKISVTR
jgi:phage protein D